MKFTPLQIEIIKRKYKSTNYKRKKPSSIVFYGSGWFLYCLAVAAILYLIQK